ncbi:MAG TPA: glycosyltransferase family 2 protein [Candidatus Omnitrophica bacterium]|nr:glycosyltransferase family 2 protein [Candidatus Omnitrophota bacterium]
MTQAAFKKSLSIVLPVYNEQDNISYVVSRINKVFSSEVFNFEIIAVDDGSTDRTPDILKGLQSSKDNFRVITHQKNKGYGSALLSGFAEASKEWVFMMDADGQFDAVDSFRLFAHAADADIVCGFRVKRRDSFLRRFLGYLSIFFIRFLFGISLKDIKCGFKLLRRAALTKMMPVISATTGMINVEIVLLAKKYRLRVKEAGVSHFPRLHGKQKGVRFFSILRSSLEVFRLKCKLHT